MKDDNLGKMGGRKSRDKRMPIKSDVELIAAGRWDEIELSWPAINQYLLSLKDKLEYDWDDEYSEEGDYAGTLIHELAKQNKARGLPTEIYFNGEDMEIPGLFQGACGIDTLILENVYGNNHCRNAEIDKLVIMDRGTDDYEAKDLLILLGCDTVYLNDVPGTLIASGCGIDLSLKAETHGTIILENCHPSLITLQSDEHKVKRLYSKGDLTLGFDPGTQLHTDDIVIVGQMTKTGKDADIEGRSLEDAYELYEAETVDLLGMHQVPYSGRKYASIVKRHRLDLLPELKDFNVSGDRKIEIVRMIGEARYR